MKEYLLRLVFSNFKSDKLNKCKNVSLISIFLSSRPYCSFCEKIEKVRRCMCNVIICIKCLKEKKNQLCQKTCYIFHDKQNITKEVYNVSQSKLPKDFEVEVYLSKVDWIRIGITCDPSIKESQVDKNDPPFEVYYLNEDLYTFYDSRLHDKWILFEEWNDELKAGDKLKMTVGEGKLRYFQNDEFINTLDIDFPGREKDFYLIVHCRIYEDYSEASINYIVELI